MTYWRNIWCDWHIMLLVTRRKRCPKKSCQNEVFLRKKLLIGQMTDKRKLTWIAHETIFIIHISEINSSYFSTIYIRLISGSAEPTMPHTKRKNTTIITRYWYNISSYSYISRAKQQNVSSLPCYTEIIKQLERQRWKIPQ